MTIYSTFFLGFLFCINFTLFFFDYLIMEKKEYLEETH